MGWIKICAAALVALALMGASPGTTEVWRFDVPAQNAANGIAAFSGQAGTVQILVS